MLVPTNQMRSFSFYPIKNQSIEHLTNQSKTTQKPKEDEEKALEDERKILLQIVAENE